MFLKQLKPSYILCSLLILPCFACNSTPQPETAASISTSSQSIPENSNINTSPKSETQNADSETSDEPSMDIPSPVACNATDSPLSKYTVIRANAAADDERNAKHIEEIRSFITQWNSLKNAHDSHKLLHLYDKIAHIRGNGFNAEKLLALIADSFENNDYKQSPECGFSVYYIYSTETIDRWAVTFNEKVTQNGRTQNAEILLILNRYETSNHKSKWLIETESDLETDLKMAQKLSFFSEAGDSKKALSKLFHSYIFRNNMHENYDEWKKYNTGITIDECNESSPYAKYAEFIDPNPNDREYYFAVYAGSPASDENRKDDDDLGMITFGQYKVDLDKGKIYDRDELIEVFKPE